MQPLLLRWGPGPLGLQPGVARRAAEHLEERARNAAVRQRDGTVPLGNERERFRDGARVFFTLTRYSAQRIEKNFRVKPSNRILREQSYRIRVRLLRNGTLLVRARIGDDPKQVSHVVAACPQLLLEKCEYLRVDRGIVGPDIIGLVD